MVLDIIIQISMNLDDNNILQWKGDWDLNLTDILVFVWR